MAVDAALRSIRVSFRDVDVGGGAARGEGGEGSCGGGNRGSGARGACAEAASISRFARVARSRLITHFGVDSGGCTQQQVTWNYQNSHTILTYYTYPSPNLGSPLEFGDFLFFFIYSMSHVLRFVLKIVRLACCCVGNFRVFVAVRSVVWNLGCCVIGPRPFRSSVEFESCPL